MEILDIECTFQNDIYISSLVTANIYILADKDKMLIN